MATQRPVTPSTGYNGIPAPQDPAHLSRGYGDASHLHTDAADFAATPANPAEASPLSQSLSRHESTRLGRFEENFDARTRGSSVLDGGGGGGGDGDLPERAPSRASTFNQGAAPSRSGTLKKRNSVKRTGSLKRSGSRRSLHAGSIRGVSIDDDERGSSRHNSVFYTPVPTSGSPTEILANRFQAWRKLLKDLIAYFREVATSYEHRSKALLKVSNVINNTNTPPVFLIEGGLNDANRILRDYHKQAVSESTKAKEIEHEVINQLSGLRADLAQKIKEIKSLSGDFKNAVEKEKETTRKCVVALEESLSLVDSDSAAIAGKGDPFVVRLGVDRQVERQIDEENYLHRAYLNLENSGRELESIVVGEIQKAYNALASILKREADESYSTIEKLRSGPVGMPRDLEWNQFVTKDPHFVNPNLPLRRLEDIEYPGKHHPAAAEVRAGMLERKSKYLKSYTPGWYVLSPTHLHEFKSADRIYTQPPVMSLLLSDQKLGSRSQPGSSSHKFVIKGRQTGSMHRGHTWVFRAETYDTMLAWYSDISNLIEKTGDERNAFVRRHARSISAGSARSVSSDGGLEEDEADQVPFSTQQSMLNQPTQEAEPAPRPSPGGRFPSDIQVNRDLQAPVGPSSGSSSEVGNDLTTASGGLQGTYPSYETDPSHHNQHDQYQQSQAPNAYNQDKYDYNTDNAYQHPAPVPVPMPVQQQTSYYAKNPPTSPTQNEYQRVSNSTEYGTQAQPLQPQQQVYLTQQSLERHDSTYGDWLAPAAGGAALGALGAGAYTQHQQNGNLQSQPAMNDSTQTPTEHDPNPAAQPLPERHPDHTAPVTNTVVIPIPVTLGTEPDSMATTPSAAQQAFLAGPEAGLPAAASEKAVNGGPVHPGMKRQDTDFSVSDLHVPGQYPKTPSA
ncbi:hypothetical protein K458DRAFT_442143 [Lentithecium fluviatile CBS 122367]|uniref:PH domain-containing protein n=1 Tax=Lentithecium fluviatile CBS 122367 TaxID=1168545 RepID=A0A6G1J6Q3_9PLEO|nr:hypothetical protein K458DRAFT_442143 [Lentithecium fluviatile CBS 122367]